MWCGGLNERFRAAENVLRRTSRTTRSPEDETKQRGLKREFDEPLNGEFHRGTIDALIHNLMTHNDSGPFRKPVVKQEVSEAIEQLRLESDLGQRRFGVLRA